jgi:hypothetical protein
MASRAAEIVTRLGARIASLAVASSHYEQARLLRSSRKRVPAGEEVESAFLGRVARVSHADIAYASVWAVLLLLLSSVGGPAADTIAWGAGLAAGLAIAGVRESTVRVVVTTSTAVRIFRGHWTGGLLLPSWPHDLVATLPRDTPIISLPTRRFDPWRRVAVGGVDLWVSPLQAGPGRDRSLREEKGPPPTTRGHEGHGST